MVRLLIIDDHPLVRSGLRCVMQHQPGVQVVGDVALPEQALALLHEVPCDAVLTDLAMPGSNQADGLPFVQQLVRDYPALTVMVLTATPNTSIVGALLAAGARAVIDKGASAGAILAGIATALAGRQYVSERFRQDLMALGHIPQGNARRWPLSLRERQVVHLLCSGETPQMIGERMGITVVTVSRLKRTAMRKLAAKSTCELYGAAREQGLLDDEAMAVAS